MKGKEGHQDHPVACPTSDVTSKFPPCKKIIRGPSYTPLFVKIRWTLGRFDARRVSEKKKNGNELLPLITWLELPFIM